MFKIFLLKLVSKAAVKILSLHAVCRTVVYHTHTVLNETRVPVCFKFVFPVVCIMTCSRGQSLLGTEINDCFFFVVNIDRREYFTLEWSCIVFSSREMVGRLIPMAEARLHARPAFHRDEANSPSKHSGSIPI